MKKYISFSLWGDKPVYTIGAIKNAELVSLIYPDYSMVVFHDDTVPVSILSALKQLNVELINMHNSLINPLFWRFLVLDRNDCELAIFRDCDSRISKREKLAVDDWINSLAILHVMRDHPYHEIPFGTNRKGILGGMWGMRGVNVLIKKRIETYIVGREQSYGIDQSFLQIIFEEFLYSVKVHDEFFDNKPFPIKRKNYRFVGERINEFDEPIGDDWIVIKEYYKRIRPSFFRKIKSLFK